jgi:hypothetical protein
MRTRRPLLPSSYALKRIWTMYERYCPICGIKIIEEYISDRWDYPLCSCCDNEDCWVQVFDSEMYYHWARKEVIVETADNPK